MNEKAKETAARSRLWLAAIPVIVFAALAALFWKGLSGNPSQLPSALIGQPVPEVNLPPVEGLDVPGFDTAALKQGQVTLVNVWGSWCAPCRLEHPYMMELSRRGDIRLFGLNYKDEPENARRFLGTLGQPYAAIVADRAGRSAIDWGVYGVPETFVIGKDGRIAYKHIGPLTPEALTNTVLPLIERLRQP